MSERSYSEREISAILQRAMERREADRKGGTARPGATATGLTLSEIQQVAREVGLDARYISEAVRDLDVGTGTTVRAGLWSEQVEVERIVAAAPTEAAWSAIEADLRRRMDTTGGDTRRYLGGWEWTYAERAGTPLLRATLTDLGGASKLHLTRTSISPPAAALFAVGGGALLAFLIFAATTSPSLLLLVALVLVGAAAGFAGSRALQRAKTVNLDRLARAADAHLHEAAPGRESARLGTEAEAVGRPLLGAANAEPSRLADRMRARP